MDSTGTLNPIWISIERPPDETGKTEKKTHVLNAGYSLGRPRGFSWDLEFIHGGCKNKKSWHWQCLVVKIRNLLQHRDPDSITGILTP